MEKFSLTKKNALGKIDKSNEGKWDLKIKSLCDKINSFDCFYTTSSCSGRILILRNDGEKSYNVFLFKSHDKVDKSSIFEVLFSHNHKCYFKMEPCALHVACKNLDSALSLLNVARSCGWKKSGVISNSKGRFICEMFSTENLCAPVFYGISEDYLEILIDEANKRLERTWLKIDNLEKSLDRIKL